MKNRILLSSAIIVIFCLFSQSYPAEDHISVLFYGKMYREPTEKSQMITILEDGCVVEIFAEKGEWLQIKAKGYDGWIQKKQTSWTSTSFLKKKKLLIFDLDESLKFVSENITKKHLAGAGFFLLVSAVLLFFLIRKRDKTAQLKEDISRNTQVLRIDHQDQSKHHAIIISNKDKNVKSAISNVHKKLSTCFREVGFKVGFVDSLKIKTIDTEFIPDIIAVDFDICHNSIKKTETVLLKSGFSEDLPVFFFNIPIPEKMEPSRRLKNTFYLGRTFTDQDILKIAGAAIDTFKQDESTKLVLKGHITGDGIFEIFQLLEIGRKSGHLKIYSGESVPAGIVGFTSGNIFYAKTVKNTAEDALHDLLSLKSGKFEFFARTLRNVNCNIAPTAVMMKYVKVEDEIAAGIQRKKGLKIYAEN